MLTDASPSPFVSVTFDGLLWGYQDELPCLPLDAPKECNKGNDPFSNDDDVFEDDGDDWGDFKRRKRSLSDKDYRIVEKPGERKSEFLSKVEKARSITSLFQVLNGMARPCPKQSSSTALATGDCSEEGTLLFGSQSSS